MLITYFKVTIYCGNASGRFLLKNKNRKRERERGGASGVGVFERGRRVLLYTNCGEKCAARNGGEGYKGKVGNGVREVWASDS